MTRQLPSLVVVTGAGSGIGRATSLRFAGLGATVIVTDIDEERAAEIAGLVRKRGGTAHSYLLNVADPDAWESFGAALRAEHGVADVLVNNAGYTTAGRFLDHTPADWDGLMAVNVMGVVQGGRVFAAQMIEEGVRGSIINVASAAAYIPIPLSTAYCATKAAVLMASECLRAELARHDIGVTAICPGFINTSFYSDARHLGADEQRKERLRTASDGAAKTIAHGPDTVAKAIVHSVRTNPAVQPVTFEAKAGYVLSRVSPGLVRLGARLAKTDGAMGNTAMGKLARILPGVSR